MSLTDKTDALLDDKDYILAEGAAWLEVAGFAIRIHTTDRGVWVAIYKNKEEMNDCLAETYALFKEQDE